MFIAGQIFGAAALVFELARFQLRTRAKIIAANIFANSLWLVSYFLLDAFTGAILVFVSIVRDICFYLTVKKSRKWKNMIIIFAAVVAIFATVFWWQDARSLLVLGGFLTMSLSLYQEKPQNERRLGIAQSIFWLLYNLTVLSIFGVITEIISLISTSIAIWRFAKKRRKKVSRRAKSN